MGKKPKMIVVCKKCGNEAPHDKEKSTETWKVFDTSKPCDKCGKHQWHVQM